MSVAGRLWQDNADLAATALAHPFVRGLADGTLPRHLFAGYIAQDAIFLESFARGYALAVARSPDRAGVDAFTDLLVGVRDELRMHESYARRWGVDLSAVTALPATLAYTDFLLATAALGGVAEICAAMTPCMRLYAHLGQRLASQAGSDTYAEWVDTYADPDFETLAVTLEHLLDTYAADVTATGDRRLATTYRRAMRLEVAFFDAAYGLP